MTPNEKCIVAFNRFLADFVRDVNSCCSPELKSANRAAYSKIEIFSADYISAFLARVAEQDVDAPDFRVLETATLSELVQESPESATTVKVYALILSAVAELYVRESSQELIEATLGIVSTLNENDALDFDEISASIEQLQGASEKLVGVLQRLRDVRKGQQQQAEEGDSGSDDKFKFDPSMLENTTIGSIAKEVVAELDMSQMSGVNSIEDVFKAMSGGGANGDTNNLIGNIVAKVGSKLQSKMTNGGINQQDLVQEAFSMFGPFMGDMLKNMPNNNMKRNSSTKDRLKKKLSERGAGAGR